MRQSSKGVTLLIAVVMSWHKVLVVGVVDLGWSRNLTYCVVEVIVCCLLAVVIYFYCTQTRTTAQDSGIGVSTKLLEERKPITGIC